MIKSPLALLSPRDEDVPGHSKCIQFYQIGCFGANVTSDGGVQTNCCVTHGICVQRQLTTLGLGRDEFYQLVEVVRSQGHQLCREVLSGVDNLEGAVVAET